jgi:Kef-type K+ transport system membrane component KefB/Trk K+ transport system NAD-binding subunit
MHSHVLVEIAVAVILAAGLAWLCRLTKQPILIAYIVAGVIAGETSGFGWVEVDMIEPVAELGLILLLFMIGLEIDIEKIRQMGRSLILPGLIQFPISLGVGMLVLPFLLPAIAGSSYTYFYLASAAALSSTLIVVKLLYDKFELDSIPGKITLGILIMQDVWAIVFVAFQANFSDPSILPVLKSLGMAAAVIAIAVLLSRYALPKFFESIAKVPELVMIAALAWCFGLALLAQQLGLSLEMGALIAGITISAFPYTIDVAAKIISLRDFFIILFFVSLGAKVPPPTWGIIVPALILAAFVFVSKVALLTPILNAFKNNRRTSFVPALNLSQMSEFSLVMCSIGLTLGHIDENTLSIVVYAFLIAALISTYAVLHNHKIFKAVEPILERLPLRDVKDKQDESTEHTKRIMFLGFSRYASSLFHDLTVAVPEFEQHIGVVDFNPEVKRKLDERGVLCIYGDISNNETLHHAHVENAEVLICTLPDLLLRGITNERLVDNLRRVAPNSAIVVTASTFEMADSLYKRGAAFVFLPRLMSTSRMTEVVTAILHNDYSVLRAEAMREVKQHLRDEVLP